MSMEQELKGAAEQVVGKAKKMVGGLTNDPALTEEGRTEQAFGEARLELVHVGKRVKGRVQRVATALLSGIARLAAGTAKEKSQ